MGKYHTLFELSIYRIVQELIGNIIKHSKATRALVKMNVHDNSLSINIQDNGIGLTEEERTEGIGLYNIRSRIKAMNGKMQLITGKDQGVCIYMEFDLSSLQTNLSL